MTMTMAMRVGDEINLRVVWGSQSRNKCPHCRRYLTDDDQLVCRCGAEYQRRPNGRYRVEHEPR